jgi:hypothetical protein
VIIRSTNAGCFAARLIRLEGDVATLEDSRRLWYWDGAATLSELAVKGTVRPENCKFPMPIPNHVVLGVIEVIYMSDEAVKSIAAVPIWKA